MVKIRVDNKEIEKSNELVKFSDPRKLPHCGPNNIGFSVEKI